MKNNDDISEETETFGLNLLPVGLIDDKDEDDNEDKANDEPIRPHEDISEDFREEYSGELCGVLVQLTDGDAKEMTATWEIEYGNSDGFEMMLCMNRRYDPITSGT